MDDVIIEKIFTYYNTVDLARILANILNVKYDDVKVLKNDVLKVNRTRYQIIEKRKHFILKPF